MHTIPSIITQTASPFWREISLCLIRAGSTIYENHGQPSGQKDNTEKISLQSHEINLGRIIENYFNMATTLN